MVDLEIERRYKMQQFLDMTDLYCGDIILGCWKEDFVTAKEDLDLYVL